MASPRPVAFNWRDRKHWGGKLRPCKHCGRATPLRDYDGKPSHKVCAEKAATLTS